MKILKAIIRGILTICIIVLLAIFGIVSNVKNIVVDLTEGVIVKELKTDLVEAVEELKNEKLSNEMVEKIESEIENNETIREVLNEYYDKIIDVLNSDGDVDIDVSKELESLVNDGEKILNEFDISLTKEEKKAIIEALSSEEINSIVNDSINEVKNNMNSDTKLVINVYSFITSMTFRMILISLIALAILLIALLRKSVYGWLLNFGIASIIAGLLMGVVLPLLTTQFIAELEAESGITLSISPINNYGYILIGLGIISIVLKRVFDSQTKECGVAEQ